MGWDEGGFYEIGGIRSGEFTGRGLRGVVVMRVVAVD